MDPAFGGELLLRGLKGEMLRKIGNNFDGIVIFFFFLINI